MPPKTTTKAKSSSKAAGTTKAVLELVDSPPPKKAKVSSTTTTAKSYSIESKKPYTINQYPSDDHDKIDLILHEGGLPGKHAQPTALLLPDGMSVSIDWKVPQKLFTNRQAAAQGIDKYSSRFAAYTNNMQVMSRDGVHATDGFYRGTPQIIPLLVKCVGNPKVKRMAVPTGEKYEDSRGVKHEQYNSMYVVELRVDNHRVRMAEQVEEGNLANVFGFFGSQNSKEW